MQLLNVNSRQASQSVRGTASQTDRCAVSFRDETSYVRQARSALAAVHMRSHFSILLLPMPSARDIWIVDAASGCPMQRKARLATKPQACARLMSYWPLAHYFLAR